MVAKIYADLNYFIIEVVGDDTPDQDGKSQVLVEIMDATIGSERYKIKSPQIGDREFDLVDICDKNGIPYNLTTWTNFYRANTGNFNTTSGGSGVGFDYVADNYTDLITNVAPTATENELAIVYNSQGVWLINRKLKGVYIYQSGSWEYANQEMQNYLQTALQPGDDVSTLTNDAGFITASTAPVQSVTGDGVGGTSQDVVLTFPDADEIDDSLTANKWVKKLYIDLDSSEGSVTRTVSGGRTTFTINHNFGTQDVFDRIYRISDGRRLNWRIETTTNNDLEASRAGNVADGVFRILIHT